MIDERIADQAEIASRVLALFRQGLTARAIAEQARIGERTARRYVRVFKLWQEGRDLMQIQAKCDSWSLDRIRYVVQIIQDEGNAVEKPLASRSEVDSGYLARHRAQLISGAETLRKWSRQDLGSGIRDALKGSWPAPLNAATSAPPFLPFRVDPFLDCLADHLEGLALRDRLERVSTSWDSYIRCVRDLLQHAKDERSFDRLDEAIELAQIEIGLGAIRKPDTELFQFHLEEKPSGWKILSGAYSQIFDDKEEAELAAAYACDLPRLVAGSVEGKRTVDAHDRLTEALKNLSEALADRDLLEHAISHSVCARCRQHAVLPRSNSNV